MARKNSGNKSRPKWATGELPIGKTDKTKRLAGEGRLKGRGREERRGREDSSMTSKFLI